MQDLSSILYLDVKVISFISTQVPVFNTGEIMLKKLFASAFTALTVMGLTVGTARTSLARGGVEFFCDTSQADPVMKLRIAEREMDFIRWQDRHFERLGVTRAQRCQEIANRFQHHQKAGNLDYISHGYVNNQPAICIPQYFGSQQCKDLLITLKPEYRNESLRRQLVEELWLTAIYGNTFGPVRLGRSFDENSSSINMESLLSEIRAESQD